MSGMTIFAFWFAVRLTAATAGRRELHVLGDGSRGGFASGVRWRNTSYTPMWVIGRGIILKIVLVSRYKRLFMVRRVKSRACLLGKVR